MDIISSHNNSDEPLRAGPLVLLLLDGWGIAPPSEINALASVKTPGFSNLTKNYPVALLQTGDKTLNARYLSLGSGQDLSDENIEPALTLTKIISAAGKKQIKITETERLAALTHFFNGHEENRSNNEDWLIVSSQAGQYSLNPTLSLKRVIKAFLRTLADTNNLYDFIVIALPTLDLVARGGDQEAVKKIIKTLDKKIKLIATEVLDKQGTLIISAALGNAEKISLLGGDLVDKEMTANPVPFILINEEFRGQNIGWPDPVNNDLSTLTPLGGLENLAPTILELLNLEKPSGMSSSLPFDKK